MARNRKNSPAEDLMELIAMLPWWVGCALALVSYWLFHRMAVQELAISVVPGQIAGNIVQSVWKTLAGFAQYLVPLLCFVSAGVSAVRRHQRQRLVTQVAGSAADAFDGMSWQEFELLVGEAFRLQGYQVTENGGGGADGGVDLVLRKAGDKFLVQCKQWKAFTVGVTVVRELYGVMAAQGAAGGFVVTSGRFTDEATSFASGRNVTLMDGPSLHVLIQQVTSARVGSARACDTPVAAHTAASVPAPSCPVCSTPMVQRTSRRGSSSGSVFWGCDGFPACLGTRRIE